MFILIKAHAMTGKTFLKKTVGKAKQPFSQTYIVTHTDIFTEYNKIHIIPRLHSPGWRLDNLNLQWRIEFRENVLIPIKLSLSPQSNEFGYYVKTLLSLGNTVHH